MNSHLGGSCFGDKEVVVNLGSVLLILFTVSSRSVWPIKQMTGGLKRQATTRFGILKDIHWRWRRFCSVVKHTRGLSSRSCTILCNDAIVVASGCFQDSGKCLHLHIVSTVVHYPVGSEMALATEPAGH